MCLMAHLKVIIQEFDGTLLPSHQSVNVWGSIDGKLRGILSEDFGPTAAGRAAHEEVM